MERLAKHPQVGGYGEILLGNAEGWSNWPPGAADRPFFITYLKERDAHKAYFRKYLDLFSYLDYIYEPRLAYRAIGFKLMYSHVVRYPAILAYLRRRRVRILHLARLNLLDVVLSREAMGARTFVHARSPAEQEMVRVHLDTTRLLRNLARLDLERRLARFIFRRMGVAVYETTYESLLADDTHLVDALRFLGIDASSVQALAPTMLRLAPESHRAGIDNYDDVATTLQGTRFAAYLHA
jgi:hypothetical protein